MKVKETEFTALPKRTKSPRKETFGNTSQDPHQNSARFGGQILETEAPLTQAEKQDQKQNVSAIQKLNVSNNISAHSSFLQDKSQKSAKLQNKSAQMHGASRDYTNKYDSDDNDDAEVGNSLDHKLHIPE